MPTQVARRPAHISDPTFVELETKVHMKVRNHGEGPILGPSSGPSRGLPQ